MSTGTAPSCSTCAARECPYDAGAARTRRAGQEQPRYRAWHSEPGQPGFAASRAYYTMFYIAEAFLLGEGLTYSRHTGVHSGLNQHFVRTGRIPAEFYTYLVQAFALRQQGDYSTKPISPERATEQIARAERFIELAEQQL